MPDQTPSFAPSLSPPPSPHTKAENGIMLQPIVQIRSDSLVPPTEVVFTRREAKLELGHGDRAPDADDQAGGGWIPRRIRQLKSPLLMLLFFFIGFAMSLSHCIFYPTLKGVVVGSPDSQEEKLQFGTAFAFLAQICLTASVWLSYTQWLWRTVSVNEVGVSCLNAMFGADTSIMWLLNREMLKKLKVGSAMALLAWTLILPPFFVPATLFVYPSTQLTEVNHPMPYLSIGDSQYGHKYAFSPPILRGTTQNMDDVSRAFTGPRTVLGLLSTATASLGEILYIRSPFNSSIYSLDFSAPIVKCNDANMPETDQIEQFLQKDMAANVGGANQTDSAYFSFVPTYTSTGELIAEQAPRLQAYANATNQLWMTFLRRTPNDQGAIVNVRHYQVCTLYNATYHVTISQHQGFQNVSGTYAVHEAVNPPVDNPSTVSNMTQHAYSAFMWALADQLVGHLSWFVVTNQTNPNQPAQYGEIKSPIAKTSLLGSSDLDSFYQFDEEHQLYTNHNDSLSDQRLQDKALAKNRTLDVLIEELSFNFTMSLMHNDLLTVNKPTPVLVKSLVNRYAYKPFGLFIPYALANFFTLLVVLLGMYSFMRDGVNPDRRYEDIVAAVGDSAIAQAVKSRRVSVSVGRGESGLVWRTGTVRMEGRESVSGKAEKEGKGVERRSVLHVGRVRVLWSKKRERRGGRVERRRSQSGRGIGEHVKDERAAPAL